MKLHPAAAYEFRQRLLTSPGEQKDAEYKRSVPFDGRSSFSLKIVRQIFGMANGGGGHIVIGFAEGPKGLLTPDPDHTDARAGTYETTNLSKRANSCVEKGQQVSLAVHQEVHPLTGNRHPIITVEPFTRTPIVCRSTVADPETNAAALEEGAVYLRRDGAETSKAVRASDWDELITRAMANRREEFLGEFRSLIDMLLRPANASAPAPPSLDDFMAEARARARGAQ
ncbi:MAG: hypothetical protein AB7T37_06165 [Dehalococcoidia bacterium]